jgi:hypothetical protein
MALLRKVANVAGLSALGAAAAARAATAANRHAMLARAGTATGRTFTQVGYRPLRPLVRPLEGEGGSRPSGSARMRSAATPGAEAVFGA